MLNLTFRVTFPSESEMAASGAVGWCDPESQTIAVSNDQPMDSMQDTFLHEVLHAICHVMGMNDTEKEESFVRRLATGLCTVWNQNPSAFKWWSGLVYFPSAFNSGPVLPPCLRRRAAISLLLAQSSGVLP